MRQDVIHWEWMLVLPTATHRLKRCPAAWSVAVQKGSTLYKCPLKHGRDNLTTAEHVHLAFVMKQRHTVVFYSSQVCSTPVKYVKIFFLKTRKMEDNSFQILCNITLTSYQGLKKKNDTWRHCTQEINYFTVHELSSNVRKKQPNQSWVCTNVLNFSLVRDKRDPATPNLNMCHWGVNVTAFTSTLNQVGSVTYYLVKPCKITIKTFTEKKLCGLFNEADVSNWLPIYVHVWKGLLSSSLNLLSVF